MQSIEPIVHKAGLPIGYTKRHAIGDSLEGGWVRSVCGQVKRNPGVPVRVAKGIYRAPEFGHIADVDECTCEGCIDALGGVGKVGRQLRKQQEHFQTPQVDEKGRMILSFWIKRAPRPNEGVAG